MVVLLADMTAEVVPASVHLYPISVAFSLVNIFIRRSSGTHFVALVLSLILKIHSFQLEGKWQLKQCEITK